MSKIVTLSSLVRQGKWRNLTYRFYTNLFKFYYSIPRTRPHGVSVLEDEWNKLIILDACRYDTFKKHNKIKGALTKRISVGCCTREWLQNTFTSNYEDIVYIAGNVRVQKDIPAHGIFHEFIDLTTSHWDKRMKTVPPHAITEAALDAQDKHPNKKLIIHYEQPMSANADLLPRCYDNWGRNKKNREKLIKEYETHLDWVLEEITEIIPQLKGNIVITSDHSNLFGEHWLWGHPDGVYTREQVEVPWFKYSTEKRVTQPG